MDKNDDRWVEERLATLTPGSGWQPNVTKGFAELRKRANQNARGQTWVWAIVTMAACLCLIALPASRMRIRRLWEDLFFKSDAVRVSGGIRAVPEVPGGTGIKASPGVSGTNQGQQFRTAVPDESRINGHSETRHRYSPQTAPRIEYIPSDNVADYLGMGVAMDGWEKVASLLPISQGPMIRATEESEPSSTPVRTTSPPYDPFEPVTSKPEALRTPEARYPAISMIRRAAYSQAFFAPIFEPPYTHPEPGAPYTVRVSFTAGGATRDGGPGEMEETRNAAGARRWTARVGSFSLTRIIADRFYDLGSPGPIPIRLQMVRWIVLGNLEILTDFTTDSIRIANAALDGASLTCILTSVTATAAAGRDWSEKEYCIDPQSERLRVYSAAPGIYIVYDYGDSAAFRDHQVPNQFTVSEAGTVVLQGTISVKDPDPSSLDPALFIPTEQMLSTGVGLLNPMYRSESRTTSKASGMLQPVVVHATLSPDGNVLEAEALQTSDRTLSQSAVELVKKMKYKISNFYPYPPQGELFVTVQ
jgi:hypothetical protein